MVRLKLKHLESELENVENFTKPQLHLEQYMTSPHIAANLLYSIDMNYGDIDGKFVADLGCGTGMLSIGSYLLGASFCIGIDIDSEALKIFQENLENFEANSVSLVKMNIDNFSNYESSSSWCNKFDTVIMNPPFGTKDIKGIDIRFIKFGLWICKNSVYSLHKSSHIQVISREIKKLGYKIEKLTDVHFDLPRTYKNHRQDSVDISVQLLKFTK